MAVGSSPRNGIRSHLWDTCKQAWRATLLWVGVEPHAFGMRRRFLLRAPREVWVSRAESLWETDSVWSREEQRRQFRGTTPSFTVPYFTLLLLYC